MVHQEDRSHLFLITLVMPLRNMVDTCWCHDQNHMVEPSNCVELSELKSVNVMLAKVIVCHRGVLFSVIGFQ